MLKEKPQVCILTAGSGTRMGMYGKFLNKALVPLADKAVISHIIEKFPEDSEFVIAVGYKAEQIKAYLHLAHPRLKFSFVEVKNYNGPGSGPGHSILCCKQALRSSFYMVAADTLWVEDVQKFALDQTWMAVGTANVRESRNYCNLIIEDGCVTEIRDKQEVTDEKAAPFTALAFVKDADLFWRGLEQDSSQGERQLAQGFAEIMKTRVVKAPRISWVDVGTEEKYKSEAAKSIPYDFAKTNEVFYNVNGRVIKFFTDPVIANNRVTKSRLNPRVFPEIVATEYTFYAYEYQDGETLYCQNSPEVFQNLLNWLKQNLWTPHPASPQDVQNVCHQFYRIKTDQRLEQFRAKYPVIEPAVLNGQTVPAAAQLLQNLNWDELMQGQAFFMHGDLQPDNIIFDAATEKFLLIDWRQDFAGETAYGDIYYDFAKLWAGLTIDYSAIKKNEFSYNAETENECHYTYPSHPHKVRNQEILARFIQENGYSVQKTKILAALIFLNMSPLHHHPFDKMLHALGRQLLFQELSKKTC